MPNMALLFGHFVLAFAIIICHYLGYKNAKIEYQIYSF